MKFVARLIVVLLILISVSCLDTKTDSLAFVYLTPEETGVDFQNQIKETKEVNYFTYPYIYMGGGVAVGDINNDGLSDIYLTSNMGNNKLYLNKGGMRFMDITQSAGVSGDKRWDTGVTMVDINADGYLDIYVSISGKWESKKNLLYVNNGDLTFTERADEFGLADKGNSTQTTFFDYDGDGDLDAYVANYPPLHFKTPNKVYAQKLKKPKLKTSDHLYENTGEHFVDMTEKAGLLNFGLSLSAMASDFNNDGYVDLYVSNDFASADFFYLNDGDGTFTNVLEESMNHTAFYGMGSDAADFNNDGLIDLMQVDMAPEDNFRSKANMASMNPASFYEMINLGLTHQYMENAFQLNHGVDMNGIPHFGDISRMTGTALTDWSWSPLFADLDNDGWKDLYITNGTRRDINNKDFFNKLSEEMIAFSSKSFDKISDEIPSSEVPNYVLRNKGGLAFEKAGKEWGLTDQGFSNGCAYADLDNDGDLDLVVNNIDQVASIIENNLSGNWLRVKLKGSEKNPFGNGARVEVYCGTNSQISENQITRGFQSSVEPIIHFGLGESNLVDSLVVTWPDRNTQTLTSLDANQKIILDYSKSKLFTGTIESSKPIFEETNLVDFVHLENEFDDYKEEVLLPHATSRYGPALAVGDIDNDGLDDFFVGGSTGFSGKIYHQNQVGFQSVTMTDHAAREDVGALFFDANGDGWKDLYVVSGGNEFEATSGGYQDRLYINKNGTLKFEAKALPLIGSSGSRVKARDFDLDGDLDLIVGGRMVPKQYGASAKTFFLENISENSVVRFKDVTEKIASGLADAGMVTDLVWTDFDGDGKDDIVVVGEWMPITFLRNVGLKFEDVTQDLGFEKSNGWWYSVRALDINGDGFDDLIVGNLGTNYKYQAQEEETFDLYVSDYDQNGQNDVVLGYYNDGKQFPVRGRQCSSEQIPDIKKKFKDYNSFAAATLPEIYSGSALNSSKVHYQVRSFKSVVLINDEGRGFKFVTLPSACQVSSINKVLSDDFDKDGKKEFLFAGNLFVSEVETKRNDSSVGGMLEIQADGSFSVLGFDKTGFLANKDVRDMELLSLPSGKAVLVVNNNQSLQIFRY